MPYESGMDPIHDTRRRFDVRFYLIAIAFLVFDVEILFLYPWAVASNGPLVAESSLPATPIQPAQTNLERDIMTQAPLYGINGAIEKGFAGGRNIIFAGVAVFFALLALGFIYDWRKGVFQWR